MYQEEDDSTVAHNGKVYNVNALLRRAANLPIDDVPVELLGWCIDMKDMDIDRINRADVTATILYTVDPVYGHVPLDGAHRVAKSILEHREIISGRCIPTDWL